MRTVLVSLVSDQTIPNILAIKHSRPDELLFLTTEKMEKKGKIEAIINTLEKLGLDYHGKYRQKVVMEDSLIDCHRKIDELVAGLEDSKFIVNLTCGTKIMAIGAYEYFKDFESRMIYIPFPKNEFITPFPKRAPSKPIPLDIRLTVTQYLSAYGLNVVNEKKLARYHEEAKSREDITKWIVKNYEGIKNLLVWLSGNLRTYRDEKSHALNEIFAKPNEKEIAFMEKIGFSIQGEKLCKELTRSEIRYLTGGWLEEFCFNEIRSLMEVDRGVDDVVIGLKLKSKDGTDNEFDVMFTKDNALYFVECKSLDQFEDKKTDVLYKIGALQKEFGLKIKSFLVTTSPYIFKNGEIRPSVKARAEQFNTIIISKDKINNFKSIMKDKLIG